MGETAMHVGAGAGQFDVVHYLHMKGAASDACDRHGDTPLFWAARSGHANIVNYLTSEENVNVNAVNKVHFHCFVIIRMSLQLIICDAQVCYFPLYIKGSLIFTELNLYKFVKG